MVVLGKESAYLSIRQSTSKYYDSDNNNNNNNNNNTESVDDALLFLKVLIIQTRYNKILYLALGIRAILKFESVSP
jgi:hypothetical protein